MLDTLGERRESPEALSPASVSWDEGQFLSNASPQEGDEEDGEHDRQEKPGNQGMNEVCVPAPPPKAKLINAPDSS